MKKIAVFSLILTTVFFSLKAGVYRHDRTVAQYAQLAAQQQFDCVGQIYKAGLPGPSCILIDATHVLSAAHCFLKPTSRPDTFSFEFKNIRYKAKKIYANDKYDYGSWQNDIAIIELEKKVTDVTPATVNTRATELHSDAVMVGFGFMLMADKPTTSDDELVQGKLAGENVIDSIGGPTIEGMASILFLDFDCPTGIRYHGSCNKLGSSIPKNLECYCTGGDSGGGLFRKNGNNWELVGIISGGGVEVEQFLKTYYYGQVMKCTRVAAYKNWIQMHR